VDCFCFCYPIVTRFISDPIFRGRTGFLLGCLSRLGGYVCGERGPSSLFNRFWHQATQERASPPGLLSNDLRHTNFLPRQLVFFLRAAWRQSQFSRLLEAQASTRGSLRDVLVWAVENSPRLIIRFGIRHIPPVVFFKDGETQDQVAGLTTKAELISRLKALI
jgi:hypothetical protein